MISCLKKIASKWLLIVKINRAFDNGSHHKGTTSWWLDLSTKRRKTMDQWSATKDIILSLGQREKTTTPKCIWITIQLLSWSTIPRRSSHHGASCLHLQSNNSDKNLLRNVSRESKMRFWRITKLSHSVSRSVLTRMLRNQVMQVSMTREIQEIRQTYPYRTTCTHL